MCVKPTTISKMLSYAALHLLHEDCHAVTSSFFMCGSELTQCRSKNCVTRNSSLCGIPTNNLIHEFSKRCLDSGLRSVPSTKFENGYMHHNVRIMFGIHHAVPHKCISSRSSGCFSHASNFHPQQLSDVHLVEHIRRRNLYVIVHLPRILQKCQLCSVSSLTSRRMMVEADVKLKVLAQIELCSSTCQIFLHVLSPILFYTLWMSLIVFFSCCFSHTPDAIRHLLSILMFHRHIICSSFSSSSFFCLSLALSQRLPLCVHPFKPCPSWFSQ